MLGDAALGGGKRRKLDLDEASDLLSNPDKIDEKNSYMQELVKDQLAPNKKGESKFNDDEYMDLFS